MTQLSCNLNITGLKITGAALSLYKNANIRQQNGNIEEAGIERQRERINNLEEEKEEEEEERSLGLGGAV